jgi:hypothetical protein
MRLARHVLRMGSAPPNLLIVEPVWKSSTAGIGDTDAVADAGAPELAPPRRTYNPGAGIVGRVGVAKLGIRSPDDRHAAYRAGRIVGAVFRASPSQ